MIRNLSLLITILCLSIRINAQVDHWESAVLSGDAWQYLVPDEQPDISWKAADFDVSSWSTGNSGIGYGDGDDATEVNTTLSVYMRLAFEVIDRNEIEALLLDMDFDDGFVAYLNGSEIARTLVSGEVPGFDQPADGLHEARLYTGVDPDRFEIGLEYLTDGTNVLAVEVHNESLTSSDMTAIPVLSLGINSTSTNYRQVPEWFDAPAAPIDFESSNLPIVVIETIDDQAIPDEPKIWATMTIIDQGEGQRNFLSDVDNPDTHDFSGTIAIEIRGSSSQILEKKQYALTTYDGQENKDNVSLLGLPDENDWILNGLAFDPSLMRDYLSYQLSLQIGQYASRGIYCEMVLNGDYRGVYILQEKLKADDNRININQIDAFDNSGDELTGGYITKSDKTEGSDIAAWTMPTNSGGSAAFIHEHPKPLEVTTSQTGYMEGLFWDLADQSRDNNLSLTEGYPSIIDIPAFVDFMLINELASNVDGYQFSTFFHKDRKAKLRAGPVWDFNLTYGNDLFFWGFDRSHTDIWQFDDSDNVGAMFWKDLFDSRTFRCYMNKRWRELTLDGQPLHTDEVHEFIDEVAVRLEEAREREQSRWNTLGDYEAHIADMKQWIVDRSSWITTELGAPTECIGEEVPQLVISKINYHPAAQGGFTEKDLEFIEITNTGESAVDLSGVYFGGTDLVYQFEANATLSAGGSVYLAGESLAFRTIYGFSPYDEFSKSLNNESESIQLLNGWGNVIDEVTYSNASPWPAADGNGDFLEVIDLAENNDTPANWTIRQSLEVVLDAKNTLAPHLQVYPNPATENVTLSSEAIMKSIKLRDISGKLLEHIQMENHAYEFSLKPTYQGVYFIEIETVKGQHLRKLIIK